MNELTYEQRQRAHQIEKELNGKLTEQEREDFEDEEKRYGAVIGSGRYVEIPKLRDRTTSMADDISKSEYKKTREFILTGKNAAMNNLDTINSLNPMIAASTQAEVFKEFMKFKRQRQPSRKEIIDDLKKSLNQINALKIRSRKEEKPKSLVDSYFDKWEYSSRESDLQRWPGYRSPSHQIPFLPE